MKKVAASKQIRPNHISRLAKWGADFLDRKAIERPPGTIGKYGLYFLFFRLLVGLADLRVWQRDPSYFAGILLISLAVTASILEWENRRIQDQTKFKWSVMAQPIPKGRQWQCLSLVCSDLVLAWFTGEQISFLLPIWEAAELLRFRYFASACAAIAAVSAVLSWKGFPLPFVPTALLFLTAIVLFLLVRIELAGREQATKRSEELDALALFNNEALKTTDPTKIVNKITSFIPSLMEPVVESCGFIRLENDGKVAALVPGSTGIKDEADLVDRIWQSVLSQESARHATIKITHTTDSGKAATNIMALPVLNQKVTVGALWIATTLPFEFLKVEERFLRLLSQHIAAAIERDRLAAAFRSAGHLTARTLKLDSALNRILRELTESLGFEFASVSLVDDFRGMVEMVRGRNLPEGWIRRAKFPLDSNDIQADILRKRTPEKIVGNDPRQDPEMGERFGHEDLAHFWVPVLHNGEGVAIIRGGCHKRREKELLTPENLRVMNALAQEMAPILAECRSHVLLEVIAREAIRLIGAGSATLHVYRNSETILFAAVGELKVKGAAEFRNSKMSVVPKRTTEVSGEDLRRSEPGLWSLGVQSMATFPLNISGDVKGKLCVHFWNQEQRFTESELRLEELFLQPMQGVIQNSLLLTGVTQGAEQALAAFAFRTQIHDLAVQTNLPSFLTEFVRQVRLLFDADVVTLYQYFPGRKRFSTPPMTSGRLFHNEQMRGDLRRSQIPYEVLNQDDDLFLSVLAGTSFAKTQINFTGRENIESVAVLQIREGPGHPALGLMFLNYRAQTAFIPEIQRQMRDIAAIAGKAISRARFEEELQWPLRALAEAGQASGQQGPQADVLLNASLDHVRRETGAKRAHVLIWDSKSASWQELDDTRKEWRAISLPRPDADGDASAGGFDWELVANALGALPADVLLLPIKEGDNALAILAVVSPQCSPDDFHRRDDFRLSLRAAVRLHEFAMRQTERIGRLECLQLIATKIQFFPHNPTAIMRFILTGVTAEQGLGFSRAVILLWDDSQQSLVPECMIGALSIEDARRRWTSVKDLLTGSLSNPERLERLLGRVEDVSTEEHPRFHRALDSRSLRPSLESSGVSRCFRTHEIVIVGQSQNDSWRDWLRNGSEEIDNFPFVCAPILHKGDARGVLVADNSFLSRQNVITPELNTYLQAFGELCAASLANAQHREELLRDRDETRRNLQERDHARNKLETERVYRQLTHQLHYPIELAEGRLAKALDSGDLSGSSSLDLLLTARSLIQRARHILKKSRFLVEDISQEVSNLEFRLVTLKEIQESIQENVGFHRHLNDLVFFECKFGPVFEAEINTTISGDLELLEQVIWELLANASRYSQRHTTVDVLTKAVGSDLVFVVTNTGIPLLVSDVDKCKEWGWRSSSARDVYEEGSGLGLFIANRLVRTHKGELSIQPTDSAGKTTVSFRIPLLDKGGEPR